MPPRSIRTPRVVARTTDSSGSSSSDGSPVPIDTSNAPPVRSNMWRAMTRHSSVDGATRVLPPASRWLIRVMSLLGRNRLNSRSRRSRRSNAACAACAAYVQSACTAYTSYTVAIASCDQRRTSISTEGLRPSDSPTRSLARRFAGALRSRGSLATLARSMRWSMSGRFSTAVVSTAPSRSSISTEGLRPSDSPARSPVRLDRSIRWSVSEPFLSAPLRRQRPAGAIVVLHVLIRFDDVGHLHVGPVPHETRAREAQRHVAKQHHFGEGTGVVEVRHRLRLLADRVEPVLFVPIASARDARQALGRSIGKRRHRRLGNETRALGVGLAPHLALAADEDRPRLRQLALRLEL